MAGQYKIGYEQLRSAWWAINRSFKEQIEEKPVIDYLTHKAFVELLTQCGWTVKQWNEETNSRSKKAKERS